MVVLSLVLSIIVEGLVEIIKLLVVRMVPSVEVDSGSEIVIDVGTQTEIVTSALVMLARVEPSSQSVKVVFAVDDEADEVMVMYCGLNVVEVVGKRVEELWISVVMSGVLGKAKVLLVAST